MNRNMVFTILVVENDPSLGTTLKRILELQGWKATLVPSLKKAWPLVKGKNFDLAVVDRILDDGDGLEIIEYLHVNQHPMMSLCLTTKGEVMERLKGLQAGADDYLPKPFAMQELLLRIKHLLAKDKKRRSPYLICDQVKFNPETGYLTADNKDIYLRRRENQIFTCLLRHQKSVVTRQMLIDTLWPGEDEAPDHSTLDVYVRRLRINLGQHRDLIKTVRGYGYMLKP